MPKDSITAADLGTAVTRLSMLEFFPQEAGTRAAIMDLLAQIVPHQQALDWLVGEYVNKIGHWHGPKELRAVLCWKYKPADGIEADSALPGYRVSDGEAISLEKHEQVKASGISEEMSQFISGLAERLAERKRIA